MKVLSQSDLAFLNSERKKAILKVMEMLGVQHAAAMIPEDEKGRFYSLSLVRKEDDQEGPGLTILTKTEKPVRAEAAPFTALQLGLAKEVMSPPPAFLVEVPGTDAQFPREWVDVSGVGMRAKDRRNRVRVGFNPTS